MNASDSSSLNESDENIASPILSSGLGESSNASLSLSDSGVLPKIKHVVLSGGGGTGFAFYGALRESHKDGFWNIKDIQTLHGVSCGSIFIGVIALLDHVSWEEYDDYLIKRPWETVFGFSAENLLNAYANVGICGKENIELIVGPVLRAVDLSLNITLQEFYDFTKIETHFYTTNLDKYKLVDLSYKTHPNWTLVDAIYSSCALPLLFRPNRVDGEVYVDGAFLCNYPLQHCIDQIENQDEIFGLNKTWIPENLKTQRGVESSNDVQDKELFDHLHSPDVPQNAGEYKNITEYLLDILAKTINKLIVEKTDSKYTMDIYDKETSVWELYEALKTKESRATKIQYGAQKWEEFKTKIGYVPQPH